MKVLILGLTGMLGNTLFRDLSRNPDLRVFATARNEKAARFFAPSLAEFIIPGIDVLNHDSLIEVFGQIKPDVVINCIGIIKQLSDSNNPLVTLPINALLPHRLNALCKALGCRLIHISTDCVFSGSKGMYLESDFADAGDLYGRSKLLGEVVDSPNAVTLRTSLIGHELSSQFSLVDWFLSQEGSTKGYTQAIFSGLPTIEMSRVIHDHVLPHPELHGLYQVATEAIDKHTLLHIIANAYGKDIAIQPDDRVRINRSLNGERFQQATGYTPPPWPQLIAQMHQFHQERINLCSTTKS